MSKYNTPFATGDKKQVTFYTSRSKYKRFQDKYPNIATMFFNKVINKALADPDFVKEIIFSDFN